ncbi:spermidine/putrescine transport system permease protein [Tranquillimonas rosea]|uniref:Spermidine/putrescine transport system permease protein n=1 Tax=Tranquillimonas rosea TaxID=641238 RepID=A0A1H9PB45_9RHOB|nr:ABC transporter permease [Tranquillimonas rosea]SER45377.1 spermidine/putrescine transport system permease protein [Tranquillimonas rosea]
MTLRVYAILYLVFLYAPIVLLPIFAFNDATVIAFPLSGFTTEWFRAIPETPALIRSVQTSLVVAVSSALLATLLGLCTARAGARYAFPGKRPVTGFIMLPLVLPEIIVAVALLVVLLALGLPLGPWTVVLGHTLLCTPFAVAILGSSFNNFDPALEEASYDLGESRWATFRLVTLPLVMPGIVSSLLISFTISLDEFIIAFFLTGTEPTLPVYLWGQLRFPQKIPVVMALGTILVALSVLLLSVAELFRRRGLARTGAKDTGGFV